MSVLDREAGPRPALAASGTVGVIAVDEQVRRRIVWILARDASLDAFEPVPAEASLDDLSEHRLLVYVAEPTAQLARAVAAARQQDDGLRVVLIAPHHDHRRLKVRHALGYGIDGVVDEDDLETALGPTVRAVIAGQCVAPGSQAADLVAPVLSHREQRVLALLALGMANSQIGERMFLATSTVKSHLRSAFTKLGVGSRAQAAAIVLDRDTAVGRGLAALIERERVGITPRPRARISTPTGDRVPFVDLERQHAPLAQELRVAFDRVAGSGAFTLGEEVELFEAEFASYCEVEHCVGVASGTAALALACAAAGIGSGDEVIVPAHTFIASALGIIHAGATPILCDVDDATGLISTDAAAAAVTARTAAILAVHLYGHPCDMTSIASLAARHGLLVLEDAAQAHGATFAGRRAGSLGTAAGFSFYPSKNLGALGDGGAICTNDPEIAERARCLRDLGRRAKGEHVLVGVNERLHGLQAALLRVKLPYLDAWNAARARCVERYREALGDGALTLACHQQAGAVHHLLPIRIPDRAAVAAELHQRGIETGVHYDRALHQHTALGDLPGLPPDGALPAAEAWAREELSLPMFAELTKREIDRVVAALRSVTDGDARAVRS